MTDKESDIALMDALIELAETAAIYGDYNGESGRTYNKANAVLALIQSDRERAVKQARIDELEKRIKRHREIAQRMEKPGRRNMQFFATEQWEEVGVLSDRIDQLTKEQADE